MARHGIRQYLDVGCGLPTTASTLDAVHKVRPDARVVYIDCDPLVIQHAQSLLTRPGDTTVLLADLRDPAALLTGVHLDGLINLAEPAGLLCTGVLDHIADDSDPHECLARLVAALAPGSYLALSHLTADQRPAPAVAAITGTCAGSRNLYLRSRAEVARFLDHLVTLPPYEGAEPGLCHIGLWGAENPDTADDASSQWWWAGIARLPTSASGGR
jgi:trans-aconitate methyltransferase